MTEMRGGWQSVTIQFLCAALACINLLPHGREPLDGEFFQSFAEPIKAGISSIVLKRKHQKNSLRSGSERRADAGLRRSSGHNSAESQADNQTHEQTQVNC